MKYAALALFISKALAYDKVQIDLYYESECSACETTITGSFADAFAHTDFLDMADVRLWPYGNASEENDGDSWTFKCQHGVQECEYNMIEVCGQHFIDDPYQQFFFVECIEDNNYTHNYESILAKCTAQVGADNLTDSIMSCWNGDDKELGIQLMHQVALQTGSLNPAHTYVPWITSNGVHDSDAQTEMQHDLWTYVCDTYTGSNKSPHCPENGSYTVFKVSDDVCNREEVFQQ